MLNSSKIYFYVYPSAFQNPGGGEILLLKTKEYLERANVPIKLFDMWNDRFKEGDLLHVFGSVKEALGLMESAKSRGVKIIHSPIIWYNWQSTLRISYSPKERALCILRQAVKTLLPFAPSARKKMMSLADLVIAGSDMEGEQIARYFLIPKSRIKSIPYGADRIYQNGNAAKFKNKYKLENFILTVGRIEPRKNQLSLIRAAKTIDHPLVIIGAPVSHHMDYYEECRKEAGTNVHFLGPFSKDSDDLISAYKACDVFALPAWFETPGLAALEAALAGVKIVITREGSTQEYFKNFAHYVDPGSVSDIQAKLRRALAEPKNGRLIQHIQEHYLWEKMAEQTIACYEQLLGSKIQALVR